MIRTRALGVPLTAALLLCTSVGAEAKGCLKGAAVGAVAGHVAGHHAVIGAAAGCVVGHHLARKKEQRQQPPRLLSPPVTPATPVRPDAGGTV